MTKKFVETDKSDIVIAATSDIHGFLDGLGDEIKDIRPDIFVIAGDINPCYMDIDAKTWFEKQFFPFVESLNIPVVAVPGNHDFYLNELLSQDRITVKKACPDNFSLICDEEIFACGMRVYGTPWIPWINGKWCWEASDKTLEYQFAKIPKNVDLLIAHSPPLLHHEFVDISTERDKAYWRHFGSMALTKAIRKEKPQTVICGHIHSGKHDGVYIRDEKGCIVSKCYNVSRVNEKYLVKYPITVIKHHIPRGRYETTAL